MNVASRSPSKCSTAAVVSSTPGNPERRPSIADASTCVGSVPKTIRAALMQ
jgi:hypothetical protein